MVVQRLPLLVISAGQTGAEIGALVAAERCGIRTGGFATRGYQTDAGRQEILQTRFHLISHPSPIRRDVLISNIQKADSILVFSSELDHFENKILIENSYRWGKPFQILTPALPSVIEFATMFINENLPQTLLVTGDSESRSPGMARYVAMILANVFKEPQE